MTLHCLLRRIRANSRFIPKNILVGLCIILRDLVTLIPEPAPVTMAVLPTRDKAMILDLGVGKLEIDKKQYGSLHRTTYELLHFHRVLTNTGS